MVLRTASSSEENPPKKSRNSSERHTKWCVNRRLRAKGDGEREKGARERQELALQMYYTDALPSALHRVPSLLPPPPLSHSLLLCTSHSSRRRRVTFAACLVCRALWHAVCASECAASWVCVCASEWLSECASGCGYYNSVNETSTKPASRERVQRASAAAAAAGRVWLY